MGTEAGAQILRAIMVTIRDVAADAGLARSTVSNVLSGKKKFPPETQQRVLESVKKLGYRPHPAARALALKRTNILGFLAGISNESADADVEVFMRFVRAAMYESHARGFDLLMMSKGEEELLGDVLADALVVMDVRYDDPRLAVLEQIGLPTVLVGSPGVDTPFSWVDLDFEQAGHVTVAHLASLGHRELALVDSPSGNGERDLGFAERFRRGVLAECLEQGLRGEVIPLGQGPRAAEDWLDVARGCLPDLSAIVAQAPGYLQTILPYIQNRGVQIPGNCSVVTVAPKYVMTHSDHPVTVIDLPGDAMVQRAVALVLDELGGIHAPKVGELLPAVLSELGTTGQHHEGRGVFAAIPAG
jgi:DNA-binding LacI/PurR family transcriptional regulator